MSQNPFKFLDDVYRMINRPSFGQIIGSCVTKKELLHTVNHFGELSDVAGRTLFILDKNEQGDCLCIVDNEYLVDVDHRDVYHTLMVEDLRPSLTDIIKDYATREGK